MTTPAAIIGAGLTGLIAAHAWPSTPIFERSPQPVANHRALLRFRGDSVARLTGVEFRKVLVRKGLWANGAFCEPTIALANSYSQKTLGLTLGDRSIWDLEPVERFVAPETFYEELVESARHRIEWGREFDLKALSGGQYISTAPLPETLAALNVKATDGLHFLRSPIHIARGVILGADVYQTIYFPSAADTSLYRASITSNVLIMEYAGEHSPSSSQYTRALSLVGEAFGLDARNDVEFHEPLTSQRYGKIAPINDVTRKKLLFNLSHQHQIYSLGRFAIWKNILLDDVVNDIDVLKRLMKAGSYDSARTSL